MASCRVSLIFLGTFSDLPRQLSIDYLRIHIIPGANGSGILSSNGIFFKRQSQHELPTLHWEQDGLCDSSSAGSELKALRDPIRAIHFLYSGYLSLCNFPRIPAERGWWEMSASRMISLAVEMVGVFLVPGPLLLSVGENLVCYIELWWSQNLSRRSRVERTYFL
jgi:hypothetical protein